ncbi:MAG: YhdP family protein [Hylemonella sp.]|uniref:YhdP family protein n=1 Tax=Hylemonella sp. TaxID=2066020 RepID=UPI0022C01362|nr:YhdP family protein [Hylemonella sp.]MCZ8252925.1 YhdP family protein [Hylemonella sp.]
MNALPRRPTLPLRALTLTTRALLWLILLAWLVFGAAWATLHLFIVPRIDELRPLLETRVSQALGLPLRIGAIVAHDHSLLPSFELQEVLLFDREGEPALYLPRVHATVSPRSLWNLGFEQLAIERPELDVRRSADGRFYVAGIEIDPKQSGDGRMANWVFNQTEWLITDGRVHWHDELRNAPPLELQQLDLRLHNVNHLHELRLDATPPAELGDRLSLRGSFREPLFFADAGEWQRWQGQLYAVFERVDISELRRHVPLPPQLQLETAGGSGALRAWVDVDQGRVSAVTADVALTQLDLRLGPELPVLELDRLAARVGLKTLEGGYELSTQGLRFDTRDGLRWRGGDMRLSHAQPSEAVDSARGELRVSGVDLSSLAALGQRLPLGPRLHRALQIYAPQGQVEQLQARWQGPWEAPGTYDARGRLSRLDVASHPQLQPLAEGQAPVDAVGSPGVRGLTLEFDLNQDGGRASVLVQQGHLELPGVFEQPRIELDQLAAELQWRRQGGQTSLQISNARFANAQVQGDFQLKWHTGAGAHRLPGVLDLQGSLSRTELPALHRYLPRAIPADVRDYLREALPQGRASAARFRVKGDLHDFPFQRPGQGEFRITAQVQDTRFVYVPASLQAAGQPAWPALTELRGELQIDRSSLQLRNIGARVDGVPQLRILKGEARIPDMTEGARVQTDLQLGGPLDELLSGLVRASPLDAMLGGVLRQARAAGPAEVQLGLDLPLQNLERSAVRGQIKLAGNELLLAPQLPRLTRARGTVHFSEQGFALAGVQGRLLGGDVRAEGGTIALPGAAAGAAPRLRVQGTLTAQGLRQESQLGGVAALARRMSGSTAYTAEFGLRQGVPEFQFNTSLQGLALDLPAPLSKPAETALPLRLQAALLGPESSGSSPPADARRQDLLRLDLGRLLSLRYVRQHAEGGVRVLRGAIGVGLAAGESVALPDEGVVAQAQFDALDLDAWRQAMATPAEPSTEGGGVSATLQDYLPTSLIVQGNTLQAGGQTLHQLVAGGTREGRVWRANVDARELSGYVEYRMPARSGAGNVYARLARLVLAQENARGMEHVLDEQPVGIPALDVAIQQFELRGKNLGRVEIEAVNRGYARRDAGAREWRLSRLHIVMPEAEFTASGNWAVYQEAGEPTGRTTPRTPATSRGERRRTVMNFQLDVADAGGLLSRLGMPDVVRLGKGRMEGQVSWVGSPLGLDYPTLGGSFNINIERGQFLKADPGLAKLLGVLSLQSLPRRLTLDFRDVFSDGFAFDFVRGDVQIDQGMASTNNLQMKGVSAAVLMSGRADLARETQDLRVVVVPEINAGTASLVATWINPAVGLGTFLAQYFLRRPAMAAATQEFRITGTWSDPQMNKVETPPPAPAAGSGTQSP